MDTPQPANRYAGSTFSGGRPTFTALPNWLAGRATAFEIAVLWTLQHHYPNICPSLNRIAMMSGLSRRTVMGVLNTLERRGWIVREHRQDQRGDSAPNHYVLTIWGEPPSEGVGQEMPHPGQELPGGRAGDALGVGQEMPPKKNNNKKNNSRKEELPYPSKEGKHGERQSPFPMAGDTWPETARKMVDALVSGYPPVPGGNLAADPQPQLPAAQDHNAPSPPKAKRMAKPKGTGTDKPARFHPTTDDIPASLLPVEGPLMAFWEAKKGEHSQHAWKGLTGSLERIWKHPMGGMEAVRDQLDWAIQAGPRSITYCNWQKYGMTTPVRATAKAAPKGPDAWDVVTACANWRDEQQQAPQPMRYAV